MARFFAQLYCPLFLLVGVGGIFLGDASSPGKGDLGPLDLNLTWARDALDIGLLLVFVVIGFLASRHAGRLLMGAAGVVLVGAGIVGFAAGQGGVAGLKGGLAINVFCVAAGALAILAAAGTVEAPEPPQGSFLRGG